MVEMANDLSSLKMKHNDSPGVLFEQLSAIEVRYCKTITDQDKLAIITAKATKDLQPIIANMKVNKGTGLTMAELAKTLKNITAHCIVVSKIPVL